MSAHVQIKVQLLDYPSSDDIILALPLDCVSSGEGYASLDLPSVDADPLACLLCSSPHIIKKVFIDREKLAKTVSEVLTDAVMQALSNKDTIMGYKMEIIK